MSGSPMREGLPSTSTSGTSSESPSVSSQPSLSPQETAGVQPLPPPKQRKPKATVADIAKQVTAELPGSNKRRPLPEEPDELDKALRIYMVIAAPIVNGMGKLNTVFKLDDWDKTEADAGRMALAAMIYENGGKLSGEILVMMWLLGVYPPRIAKRLAADAKAGKPTQLFAQTKTEEKTLNVVNS